MLSRCCYMLKKTNKKTKTKQHYGNKTFKFLLDIHIIFQNHFCDEELLVFSPELFWGLPKVLPCACSNSSHRSFTSETIKRTSHLALQYLSKAWKALFLQQDCLPPPASTNHSSCCHHDRHWCPYNHNSAATSAMEVLEIPHSDSMSPPLPLCKRNPSRHDS